MEKKGGHKTIDKKDVCMTHGGTRTHLLVVQFVIRIVGTAR